MKKLINITLSVFAILLMSSCYDDSKMPFPKFADGVNYRALPSPWTARPQMKLSAPNEQYTLNISSLNAGLISKVDVYVSYLPGSGTALPAALGSSATYANFLAPVGTAGWIPEVKASGSAPVSISYSRYDQLINGRTSTGVAFTAMPRTLFRTLTGGQITGNFTFTLAELATATNTTLPGSVANSNTAANVVLQPAFIFVFEVTTTDGRVFNYLNSGPGVTANPATGRVAARAFTGNDISGSPVTNKAYSIILSGEEGSPFIPGVSIRIEP